VSDIDEVAPKISDSEALLRRVADIIASAKTMPLSSSAMVNKDEVLELLDEAMSRLPEELKAARWMLMSTLRRPRSVDSPSRSGRSGMITPLRLCVSPPHRITIAWLPV